MMQIPKTLVLSFVVLLTLSAVNACGSENNKEALQEAVTESTSADASDAAIEPDVPFEQEVPKTEPSQPEPDQPEPDQPDQADQPDQPQPMDKTIQEEPPTPEMPPKEAQPEQVPEGKTTSTWTGNFYNFSSRARLTGVKVCLESPKGPACVNTDSKGDAVVSGVPDKKERLFSAEKAGLYRSIFSVGQEPSRKTFSLGMLPSQVLPLLAGAVGKKLQPGLGHVVLQTYGDNLIQISHMEGKLAAAGADGPYYLNTSGQPDPSLAYTSRLGLMAFLNVPVGTHVFTSISKWGVNCREHFAWPGPQPNEFRIKVEADTLSYSYIKCRRNITFAGSLTDLASKQAVAGVKVCFDLPGGASPSCATSDGKGEFRINNVPESNQMLLSAEKSGYSKALAGFTLGQSLSLDANMLTTASIASFAKVTGDQIQSGTGVVVMTSFDRLSGGATDVTMALAASGAKGPYFIDDKGQIDLTRKGTTSTGIALFLNVPAGEHTITLSGLGQQTCAAFRAWSGSQQGQVQVKVEAGATSYFSVRCSRQRTRKLGESCKQSDPTKPEYNDCVALSSCNSLNTCVAISDKLDPCTTPIGCVSGSRCVSTQGTAQFCLEVCHPSRPICAQGFRCVSLPDNTGACFEECQVAGDCKKYGSLCQLPASGGTQKLCQ